MAERLQRPEAELVPVALMRRVMIRDRRRSDATLLTPFVALLGFLVCPAAVMLEMLFQILTYGHS